MRTGFPEGWRQGGVCPAASTGGCSGRVGPGSSGTGPFRPGFSDSEGSEGFPTDSWTAVRAAQGPFPSASGTLQRAGHTPAARASTRLRPVLLALPSRLPGRSLPGLVGRPAAVASTASSTAPTSSNSTSRGARYENRSLLVIANEPFSAWGKIFSSDAMTVAADQLEEDAGLRLLAVHVGEVVEDDEVVVVELADGGFEGEVAPCRLELLHQVGRALAEHPEPVLDQREPEARGQVALARPWRTGAVVLTDPVWSSATPGIRCAVVSWKSPVATSEAARRVLSSSSPTGPGPRFRSG